MTVKYHGYRSIMKNINFLKAAFFIIGASVTFRAVQAQTQNFSETCGNSRFEISMQSGTHPLENRFELKGFSLNNQKEKRTVYVSDVGGWFYAACLSTKDKRPMLVFQEFCGGSACVEDKYGVVEPNTMKIVLTPSKKNVGNSAAASKILGKRIPHLPNEKSAFCCRTNNEDVE